MSVQLGSTRLSVKRIGNVDIELDGEYIGTIFNSEDGIRLAIHYSVLTMQELTEIVNYANCVFN